MNYKKVQLGFFLIILTITLIVLLAVFRPYFNAMLLALALAVVFHPLYYRILRRMKKHRSIASLLTVLIIILIILIPTTLLGGIMAREAAQVYVHIISDNQSNAFFTNIQNTLTALFPEMQIDIAGFFKVFAKDTLKIILDNIGLIFSNVVNLIISLFLVIFSLFYLIRDGGKFRQAVVMYSPLVDRHDNQIIEKLIAAVNSVIKGELFIAILQGLLTGIGFWLFGVPNPVLLGAITVLAALIPGVGVILVIGPALIYLIASGAGIFNWLGLAVWGLLLVGLIDNFLRPKLIERGINIHPLLIFLSVLGGIHLFGAFGFLIGPLVLSLLFALLNIYKQEFNAYLKK